MTNADCVTRGKIKEHNPSWTQIWCDYSDAYILLKGVTTVPYTAAADADTNNTGK